MGYDDNDLEASPLMDEEANTRSMDEESHTIEEKLDVTLARITALEDEMTIHRNKVVFYRLVLLLALFLVFVPLYTLIPMAVSQSNTNLHTIHHIERKLDEAFGDIEAQMATLWDIERQRCLTEYHEQLSHLYDIDNPAYLNTEAKQRMLQLGVSEDCTYYILGDFPSLPTFKEPPPF